MKKNKMRRFYAFVALVAFGGFNQGFLATAQENASETKAKLSNVQGSEGQGDVDQLITNKKLRAETGSKSKVSLTTFFVYNGGTIENVGGKNRPELRGAKGTDATSGIRGQVAGKYRVTDQGALSLGVGVQMLAPFNAPLSESKIDVKKGKLRRNDVYDPYIDYTYLVKLGGVQSVTSTVATFITTDGRRKYGYVSDFTASQTFIKDVGTTGLSLGLALQGDVYVFDKFTVEAKKESADVELNVYPFLEYVFNDTYNFRTVLGLWEYAHVRSQKNPWTFNKNVMYQSVGVGISLTRDIFLYPNVQFNPEYIRSDRTNVALQANLNVF